MINYFNRSLNHGFNAHFLRVLLQVYGAMNDERCADMHADARHGQRVRIRKLFAHPWTNTDVGVAANADVLLRPSITRSARAL